jgi:hypothetical protein
MGVRSKTMQRPLLACSALAMLLFGPLSQSHARKLLSYDGSVLPHTRFSQNGPEVIGTLAVVGGVPGSEVDDWDGSNLDNTTVSNGVLTINGSNESRFWYDLRNNNFHESIWANGWQVRARVRLPNAPHINNFSSDGSTPNPVDHPYRWQGGPHYSGYGGGHEWATHIYIAQGGRDDLGRLYRLNFYTDGTGDNDPIVNLSQYFFEPITSYEVNGKAGQFFTVDMINTQGRGGAVDVYVDGLLVIANNRPTAGLGLTPGSDTFFVGDCCNISGLGHLSIDYVELYDGVGGLPGPISNPEPVSAFLGILGGAIVGVSRQRKSMRLPIVSNKIPALSAF